MKYKKTFDRNIMLMGLNMRRAFSNGRSCSVAAQFDDTPIFTTRNYFGLCEYNRKRNVIDCWKGSYRLEYNDNICYWNGVEDA